MITIIVVIAILSIVQSIFGVGLLVFGTPTFLLLGYPLEECLLYLLPSSIAISSLQLFFLRKTQGIIGRYFLIWCLPPLFALLAVKLLVATNISVDLVVIMMLSIGAFSIYSSTIREYLVAFLQRFRFLYFFIMGSIHGVSNMGGSMLTVYANLVSFDKQTYLKTVAQGYLIFGLLQFSMVSWIHHDLLSVNLILTTVMSATIFILAGHWLFQSTTHKKYQILLSLVMLTYAALLIFKMTKG